MRLATASLTTLLCLLAAGVLSPQGQSASGGAKRLFATVTRTGQLSLRDVRGKAVTRLRAGSYVVTVRDRSKRQNFHLTGGPAINKRTGITFVGTLTWRLTLANGTYRYLSDGHPTRQRSFTVVS